MTTGLWDGQLSLAERKEQRAVLAAYGDFWTQLRFRKGWSEPPFSRQDVLPLLERGAALVAMIREDLDTREPGFKLRMVDGSARDYMYSVTYSPLKQPDRFVVELVHATFKDGRGYVEGLDEQQVDDYIRRFSNNTLPPLSALQSAAPRDKEDSAGSESMEGLPLTRQSSVVRQEQEILQGTLETWKEVSGMVEETAGLVTSGWASHNARRLLALRKVLVSLQNVKSAASEVLELARDEQRQEQERQAAMEVQEPPAAAEKQATTKEVVEEPDEVVFKPARPTEETEPTTQQQQQDQQQQTTTTTGGDTTYGEQAASEQPSSEGGEQLAAEDITTEPSAAPAAASSEPESMEVAREVEADSEAETEGPIEIQKVAEDVDQLKGQIQGLTQMLQGLELKPSEGGSSNTGRVLEDLQGRCGKFTEALIQGLNVLDELHVSDKDRPLRKNQVMQIQQLIDDVEQLRERLRGLRAQLRPSIPKAPTPPSTPEVHPTRTAQNDAVEHLRPIDEGEEEEPDLALVGQLSLGDIASVLSDHWRRLKFNPKFRSVETPDAYILQAFIPGMRLSDLSVSMGPHGTVTVKGYRGPNRQELAQLVRQVGPRAPLDAVLKAGVDRFGSFIESLKLPHDADADGLEALYEKGVLRLIIPRIPMHIHGGRHAISPFDALLAGGAFPPPPPERRSTHRPRGGRGGRGGRGPPPQTFWDDADLWW